MEVSEYAQAKYWFSIKLLSVVWCVEESGGNFITFNIRIFISM